MTDTMCVSIIKVIRTFVGVVGFILVFSYANPEYLTSISPILGVSNLYIISMAIAFQMLVFSLEVFGALILLPFEYLYARLKEKSVKILEKMGLGR